MLPKICFNFATSVSNIVEGIESHNNAEQRYIVLLGMTENRWVSAVLLL